jgi:hypothetical protein
MQGTNTGRHYLEYYSDWSLALFNSKQLSDMRDVEIKASAFIGIINELWDADRISIELVSQYIEEVNNLTWKKFIVFNN